MVIVCGHLEIEEGKRELFLSESRETIIEARKNRDCLDFTVSADLIEKNRVNIFESWKTKKALNEFRGSGPSEGLTMLIKDANVKEYDIR